jgi:YidC/Oxa1 family membrane protein insertase
MAVKLTPSGKLDSVQLLKILEKDGRAVELCLPPIHPEAYHPLTVFIDNDELIPVRFSSIDKYTKKFEYKVANNPELYVIKTYKLIPGTYFIKMDITLKNYSDTGVKKDIMIMWESPCKVSDEQDIRKAEEKYSHLRITEQAAFTSNDVQKVKHHKIGILQHILIFLGLLPPVQPIDSVVKKKDVTWVAQSSHYFLNIIIMSEIVADEAIFVRTVDNRMKMGLYFQKDIIKPNSSKTIAIKIYTGPKDYFILRNISPEMVNLTAFSGWNSLSLIILWILQLLYNLTHNYGVAIILLTFIIKVLLHPLTKKNFKTMMSMQKLQPYLQELRKKHKNDIETLNREMMALYKRHKVNPLGGCLPILLQIPVFIALFTTLSNAIELRGAEFLIWKDLSTKDPYYILPVLMGLTMLLQQKMMPSPDPNQAKIGIIMSILFIFIFLGFPSGLVLYWLVQNILTIIEQMLIKKGIEK